MDIKNKHAQSGIFGLSFNMIVSIILIVFFIAAAFMGIRSFLRIQECANMKIFLEDLQGKINEAWNAESASYNFTAPVPSGVEFVCFVNLSAPAKNANSDEKAMYEIMETGTINSYAQNFYIYAPKKNYCITWKTLKNIDFSEKNPICIQAASSKVKMQMIREYSNPLVKIRE